jgi:RimJ/RimL family protein N-acetyltransferase
MFPEITRDDVFRLETPRLWLRWPACADAPAVEQIASLRDVADMTARIPHPYPKGAADAFVAHARAFNESGRGLRFVAQRAQSDRGLVGMVGVEPDSQGTAEIGFAFHPGVWGEGLATEAAQALIDAVFTLSGLPAIRGSARVVNPASRRVLQKCGFAYDGSGLVDLQARGGLFPVDHFVLDRKAWRSLKGWGVPRFVRPDTLPASLAGCVA